MGPFEEEEEGTGIGSDVVKEVEGEDPTNPGLLPKGIDGQRSNRVAECKRRVIRNCFSERICYMFPIPKCREDRDLGLSTSSFPPFGKPPRNGKIRFFLRQNTFFFPQILALRSGFRNASTKECAQT